MILSFLLSLGSPFYFFLPIYLFFSPTLGLFVLFLVLLSVKLGCLFQIIFFLDVGRLLLLWISLLKLLWLNSISFGMLYFYFIKILFDLLISSLTHYSFSNINPHDYEFTCLLLVIGFYVHTNYGQKKNAWDDFNLLIKSCFVNYPKRSLIYIWKECVFCCLWVKFCICPSSSSLKCHIRSIFLYSFLPE